MAYRYRRSNLTAPAAEATSLWTIWWDTHRRAGTEGWSRAIEPTRSARSCLQGAAGPLKA